MHGLLKLLQERKLDIIEVSEELKNSCPAMARPNSHQTKLQCMQDNFYGAKNPYLPIGTMHDDYNHYKAMK